MREVERAWLVPRPADVPSPESVTQQLAQLHHAAQADAQAPVSLLAEASRFAQQIVDWSVGHLGQDAPSLQPLLRLLKPFEQVVVPVAEVEAVASGETFQSLAAPRFTGSGVATRGDVQHSIRTAREWFEDHEPSSPVAVLLRQAERMVGRRFAQVADAIPLDLLRKWDAEGDAPQ